VSTPAEKLVEILEAGLTVDLPDGYPDPPPTSWTRSPNDVRPDRDHMPARERGDWIDYAEYLELKLATAKDAIHAALQVLGRQVPTSETDRWGTLG
jgi:hypothetical protein